MITSWKLLFRACRIQQPDKKVLAGTIGIGRAPLLCTRQSFGGFRFEGKTDYSEQRRSYSSAGVRMADDKRKFRLAVIQMAVGPDKDENLKKATELIEDAAKKGAKMVGLPECFNSPYGIQYFGEYAETIPDGPTAKLISGLAERLSLYIIAGSIPELGSDSKLYNTCMIYGPTGALLGRHRKVHLFDIDIPGRMTFQESKVLTAGDALTIVQTEYCRLGIGICYDMRFPEMAQIYRNNGCDLLMYPGAFNMTTGPAHWQILQQGRAVDNQVYVATIAPARDVKASYVAWGHSMIVSPWGKILAEADETETTLIQDIDLDSLTEVRQQIPVSVQKRSDLYEVKAVKDINNSVKS